MQTRVFRNKKARWMAAIIGLEILMLFALKACEHPSSLEFLPFDPDIFSPVKGESRAAALWLILTLLGLAALFFLFRMFASGGSTLGKTVLASTSIVALLLATQVPDDVKPPSLTQINSTAQQQAPIVMEELSCLDMGCFDGGGPSLPAAPPMPSPNAGNTGV